MEVAGGGTAAYRSRHLPVETLAGMPGQSLQEVHVYCERPEEHLQQQRRCCPILHCQYDHRRGVPVQRNCSMDPAAAEQEATKDQPA